MAINFPDSPSDGDEATLEGKVYTYNASKNAWTPASSGGGGGGGGGITTGKAIAMAIVFGG
jgi:hypothetical protein